MPNARIAMAAAIAMTAAACGSGSGDAAAAMSLTVPAWSSGTVPARFTCDGEDLSPALSWTQAPPGTRSFAVVLDDPDAPGGTFAHWAAFDLDAKARGLAEGAGRPGAPALHQATNDFDAEGYRGPCPPPGKGAHHYRFRLFALDVPRLDVAAAPKVFEVQQGLDDHVLATADFTATYSRPGP